MCYTFLCEFSLTSTATVADIIKASQGSETVDTDG